MTARQRQVPALGVPNEDDAHELNNTQNRTSPSALQRLQNEINDFLSPIWRFIVRWLLYSLRIMAQAIITILACSGFVYVLWTYIVKSLFFLVICKSFIGGLPYISDHCAIMSERNGTILTLPINQAVQSTVALAERLADTDVSTTVKLTEVKISLVDLKVSVRFSQLEQATKAQLTKQINQVVDSIQLTTDEMHKMLASFNGALTKMNVYTDSLYKYLQGKVSTKPGSQTTLVTTTQNEVQLYFENYLKNTEKEIEDVIHIVESVHSKIELLEKDCDILSEFAADFYNKDEKDLNAIDNASWISHLYRKTIGDGDVNKVKYQRNMAVLDQFPTFTKSATVNINNVMDRLNSFKHLILNIKSGISTMDRAQTLSLDIQMEVLKANVESLQKFKQRLHGRIINNRSVGA